MQVANRLAAPVAIWTAAAFLVAGLWAAALHFIAADRAQAIDSAQREHANLAYTLGEQNARALRNVESALRNAARQWQLGQRVEQREAHNGRLVGQILLVDADGQGRLENGRTLDASHQEYYLVHRDDRSAAAHVGRPTYGRLTGGTIIPLSIRLEDRDGRFAGVMVASIAPDYFSRLYDKPDLGRKGSVLLVGTDGIVRACSGGVSLAPGADVGDALLLARQKASPLGHFRTRGKFDGVQRYTSYVTLPEFSSLVLAVGRDEHDVLAAHERMARMGVALATVATLMIALLAAVAASAAGRQRQHVVALAASEERYRDVYENAVEGIVTTARDGRILDANPAMARLAGYQSVAEFVTAVPDIRRIYLRPEQRLAFQQRVESDGFVNEGEYELVQRDGGVIWVSMNARGVRDATGAITHYEAFLNDINARKREEELRAQGAELALRRYQELLARLGVLAQMLGEAADLRGIHRAALAFARESAPVDGMFVSLLDAARSERRCVFAWGDGREEDVSALPALPMTGSPHARAVATGCVIVTDHLQDALAGQPHHDIGGDRDPRQPQSSLVVPMQVMGRVIGGFEVQSMEPAAYREEHVTALQVAAPLVAMALDNVRLLAEERGNRHRAEQAERHNAAILASAMDAIVTLDAEDRVVDFSPAAEKLFGVAREQALGRSLADLVLPAWLHDEYRETLDACLRAGRAGGTGARVETTALRGDGKVFPVELSVTHVPGSDPPLLTAFLRDITERQRSVLALRQSEARYREAADELAQVIDGSLDAICVLDSEGRFLRVSAACQLIWGYAPEKLIGRALVDMVHADDRQKTRDVAREIVAGRPTRDFENRCLRSDGSIANVMWSARWRAEDATMLCVARDVTEGKLMAEANRHLDARLHETLENLTSGFATVDRNWRVTYVNRETEVVLGRAREGLVGEDLWRAVPGLAGSTFESQYRCAMSERVTIEFQEFLPEVGRWFEVRAYPTTDGGLALYFHDVTERQRALRLLEETERRFEHVALATSDAVWDWNFATSGLWWSEGLKTLFGYDPATDMSHMKDWIEAVHPDERERIEASCQAALSSDATRWSGEYRFRRRDGTYAMVIDQASILRDARGNVTRMVGGMTDITERRELERQLMRTQRIESLGTLAGGIAHDLNNVFTPIMMGLDLLEGDVGSGDGADVVSMIRASATRGAEMVKQVLHFARGIEGEKLDVKPRLLLEEVERMMRETFPRNIELRVRSEPGLPAITGDPTQLHQVLLNLCVNARDAMPEGGTLTLRARGRDVRSALRAVNGEIGPGRYIVLEVEDTGRGIEDAVLERIFDPFFTTKPPGAGTGLGLSTSLAIVRKHGGFVHVTTAAHAGSLFSIYLPLREAGAPTAPTPAPGTAPTGAGETILLVEDEAGIRELARRALESAGYRVVTAANGAEALASFRRDPAVDVVVTDMMMPVMDGAALVRALGELAPGLPVICTSGIAPAGTTAAAASTGAPFIAKPYTTERLVAAVQKVLPGRAAA